MSGFQKATKKKTKARVAFLGPAGSGKTYSMLKVLRGLAGPSGRIAVIDSEHGSASKYSGDVADFDVLDLEDDFSPDTYVKWIEEAERAGYAALGIDSLSHAWSGKGGILEFVDRQKKGGNNFSAWGDATPKHNRLIEAMLSARLHLVVTMRTKMEYVQEKDERTGKTVVRKVGMQPVQRDGLEYEFDVVGDMNQQNELAITKTRCSALNGAVIVKPDERLAETLLAWLTDGVEAPPRERPAPPSSAPRTAPPPNGAAKPNGNGHAPQANPAQERAIRIALKAKAAQDMEAFIGLVEQDAPDDLTWLKEHAPKYHVMACAFLDRRGDEIAGKSHKPREDAVKALAYLDSLLPADAPPPAASNGAGAHGDEDSLPF